MSPSLQESSDPGEAAKRAVAPATIAACRRLAAVVVLLGLAASVGGCAGISEQSAALAMVSPGKFDIYTCQDIEHQTKMLQKRQTELEQLMARSAQGPGGALVNAIAYRTEYLETRGSLDRMAKVSAEKQCSAKSRWSSERALF